MITIFQCFPRAETHLLMYIVALHLSQQMRERYVVVWDTYALYDNYEHQRTLNHWYPLNRDPPG